MWILKGRLFRIASTVAQAARMARRFRRQATPSPRRRRLDTARSFRKRPENRLFCPPNTRIPFSERCNRPRHRSRPPGIRMPSLHDVTAHDTAPMVFRGLVRFGILYAIALCYTGLKGQRRLPKAILVFDGNAATRRFAPAKKRRRLRFRPFRFFRVLPLPPCRRVYPGCSALPPFLGAAGTLRSGTDFSRFLRARALPRDGGSP